MNKILSLEKSEEWYNLFKALPSNQQDLYFTPNYYKIFEKNGDGQAQCFVHQKDGQIALYPYLINSVSSFGYKLKSDYFDIQGAYGFNGVAHSKCDNAFKKSFHNEFNDYCHDKKIIAEFIRYNPIIKNHNFSKNFYELELNRKTVFLDLSKTYDEIFSNQFSSKNRNMINKGSKTLNIEFSNKIEDILRFKKMYTQTMNRINATDYYYFSEDFFLNISNFLADQFYLITAYDKVSGDPAGSIMIFIYNSKCHYFLSARSKNCKNNSVNNYLLSCAIKFSIKKNCNTFHFGGGNSLENNDPLFKFKKNFSKETLDFYISKRIIDKEVYREVCGIWEKENQDKIQSYQNQLLKYHQVN